MNTKNTHHRDGTLTYWSVYRGHWVRRVTHVPDQELAAMNEQEREKALRHLAKAS